MAPIRHEKEIDKNIPQHHVPSRETPVSNTNYHVIIFLK
jgi:hypothetical protein